MNYFTSPIYKAAHSSNPYFNHQFDLKPTCQVKDILVCLSPSIKENSNNFQNDVAGGFVEGTIEYSNLFKSNLSFTNTQLEIEVNKGFYFNILDN